MRQLLHLDQNFVALVIQLSDQLQVLGLQLHHNCMPLLRYQRQQRKGEVRLLAVALLKMLSLCNCSIEVKVNNPASTGVLPFAGPVAGGRRPSA